MDWREETARDAHCLHAHVAFVIGAIKRQLKLRWVCRPLVNDEIIRSSLEVHTAGCPKNRLEYCPNLRLTLFKTMSVHLEQNN